MKTLAHPRCGGFRRMKAMNEKRVTEITECTSQPRRPWSAPAVHELPRLTELTLQSFIPGEGFPGGGGSTVF